MSEEEVLKRIEDMYKKCSKENWDGYGAMAISRKQKDIVINFIKTLSSLKLELPIVSAGGSGHIGLTWYNKNNNKEIIAEINRENKLFYNFYYNGNQKIYGVLDLNEAISFFDILKSFSKGEL